MSYFLFYPLFRKTKHESFHDLLVEQMQDLYDAEHQLAMNTVNPTAQDMSEDESMRTGTQKRDQHMAGVR